LISAIGEIVIRGAVVAALLFMVRSAVGVLVAALVGLHCGAAPDPDEVASKTSESSETSAPSAPRRPPPAEESPAEEVPEPAPAPIGPDLLPYVSGGTLPHVTSVVQDETGATFATGTFVGSVAIGDTVINSRGQKDVFLLKLDPAGKFAWVRAVGSPLGERSPRVAIDGESISLIGMTKGEMNCGAGPLRTWSSETFFFCMFGGSDGAVQAGGVFPTGSP